MRYFVVAAVTINVLVFPFVLAFHGPVCLCRKRENALPQTWSAGPVSLHREARRGLLKFRLYILGQTAAHGSGWPAISNLSLNTGRWARA